MPPELSFSALDLFFASHSWHGVDIGTDAPAVLGGILRGGTP
jgi:hypothetical protein